MAMTVLLLTLQVMVCIVLTSAWSWVQIGQAVDGKFAVDHDGTAVALSSNGACIRRCEERRRGTT